MRLKSFLKQKLRLTALFLVYARRINCDPESLDAFARDKYDPKSTDLNKVKRLLKTCFVYGGLKYHEFYAHHLENKPWSIRTKVVPCNAQNNLYVQVNSEEWLDLLEDKGKCYDYFKKYYDRDLLAVHSNDFGDDKLTDVIGFAEKHPVFLVKPLNSAGGQGIKMVDISSKGKDNLHTYFDEYPDGFVLEERIIQAEEMALMHKNSVNTIRVQTVNYGDSIEIKWPCLRTGRGGSVVDNVFMGGVFVGVDRKTGITFGKGKDALGRTFTEHPDSKIRMDGFQVPRWKDLCDLLEEMAKLCPTCHIIGWDMALTERGWILVEANYGPELIYQDILPDGGFYEEFVSVRKRLHAGKFKGYQWENQLWP